MVIFLPLYGVCHWQFVKVKCNCNSSDLNKQNPGGCDSGCLNPLYGVCRWQFVKVKCNCNSSDLNKQNPGGCDSQQLIRTFKHRVDSL